MKSVNLCLGDSGMGFGNLGKKSGRVPGRRAGSWLGNGEFLRLTMRAFARLRLLTQRNVAASSSRLKDSITPRSRSRARNSGQLRMGT